MSKKGYFLIGSGILNLVHAGTHILQFIQSVFLISYSKSHDHEIDWMHSPWMSLIWGTVGVLTLAIGIKDYIHHRECKIKNKTNGI